MKILINLGLQCWSTILLGHTKGWVSRNDFIAYAVDLLVNGNNDEDVAVIAGGEPLGDDELYKLISNQIVQTDTVADLDKWRLAHLLNIAESEDDEQTKLDRLQEVYTNFDYPEDMASCSIYSQDQIDPLVAMMQVVEELKRRLTQR